MVVIPRAFLRFDSGPVYPNISNAARGQNFPAPQFGTARHLPRFPFVLRTFYEGLTQSVKPVTGRARLTYLPETQRTPEGPQLISPRSDAEALPTRVKRYFGALETLDADAASAFFAAGAAVRLPGLEPILGRAAIRRALVQLSLDVDDLSHAPVQLWIAGNLTVFEADMTLRLAAGRTLAFPVTHVIRWAQGLIEEARVSVYLESRMAVALSAFDRLRNAGCELRRPA